VVEKLSNRANEVSEVSSEMSNIFSHSKEKLNSLKSEINRAMSTMTNGYAQNERFDFALDSAGGKIMSHHGSQLMYDCSLISILSGLCSEINPPIKAIQSSIEPGQSFCFKGEQGSLTIKLACNVAIDSVTIDHMPQAMAPIEYASEAPKEFSVRVRHLWHVRSFIWLLVHIFSQALKDLKDPTGVDIGKFTFDPTHYSQTFQIFGPANEKFRYVQLNITGNHGSEEKTCLYRVRVHGFVDEC
jgi:SUN domain-containing protein 1/2